MVHLYPRFDQDSLVFFRAGVNKCSLICLYCTYQKYLVCLILCSLLRPQFFPKQWKFPQLRVCSRSVVFSWLTCKCFVLLRCLCEHQAASLPLPPPLPSREGSADLHAGKRRRRLRQALTRMKRVVPTETRGRMESWVAARNFIRSKQWLIRRGLIWIGENIRKLNQILISTKVKLTVNRGTFLRSRSLPEAFFHTH